jgi:transmembrane sensor
MIITEEKWKRYLDNQCTDEERIQMLQYLQSLTGAELEALLEEPGQRPVINIPEATEQRLDLYVSGLMDSGKKQKKRSVLLRYYWAAACIAAVVVCLFLFNSTIFRTAGSLAGARQYDSVFNQSPHLKRITLPDSTGIWLTPGSLLQVASGYAKDSRDVMLEGEAYFEIQPDQHRPFSVVANGIHTIVLGTHFNIEAYAGESETRITLTEGKLALQLPGGPDSSIVLTPGKRLLYRHKQRASIIESVTGLSEADWKNGAIVLKDLPAVEVFQRLERRFGKKILFDDSMFVNKRFTATYYRQDLTTILKNMAFIHGFDFDEKVDTILVHSSQ